MTVSVVQIISGLSSVTGLFALLGYFYVTRRGDRAERSVRDIVEGDQLFESEQVLQILTLFSDDERRLEALGQFAELDRTKAKQLLEKIKQHVDVRQLQADSNSAARFAAALTGGVLLLLGLLGLAWASQQGGNGSRGSSLEDRVDAQSVAASFIGSMNRGDVPALAELITLPLYADGFVYATREDFRRQMQAELDRFGVHKKDEDPHQITVSSVAELRAAHYDFKEDEALSNFALRDDDLRIRVLFTFAPNPTDPDDVFTMYARKTPAGMKIVAFWD